MSRSVNWWLIGTIVFFILFVYLLSPILTPFFLAALLAYLGDPIVNRLVQFKIPRTLAATVVFVFFILIIIFLLVLLIPMLARQIAILINYIPEIFNWLQQTALPWIGNYFQIENISDISSVKSLLSQHLEQAANILTGLGKIITHSGYSLFVFILNLILVPVVTFYLLRDWDEVIKGAHKLLPRAIEPLVVSLLKQCNEVIGAFFRGQFLVMLALGFFYSLCLSLMGLNLALLLGIIVGLMSIVPYLGFTIGIIIALIAAFLQFNDWVPLIYVLIIFSAGHLIENYILYPKLIGGRIGLHPVAVIFAILAGGQLFGFIGVLLALPVAAVIMVVVRYMIQHYLKSDWYTRQKTSTKI
jgi:predicted PurR-regulated permease PerM